MLSAGRASLHPHCKTIPAGRLEPLGLRSENPNFWHKPVPLGRDVCYEKWL